MWLEKGSELMLKTEYDSDIEEYFCDREGLEKFGSLFLYVSRHFWFACKLSLISFMKEREL